jgi:murein L,D-transpeptidase YafK
MSKESPILIRAFKEESELEVWKQDNNGQYALLKTYPICRWSGELGPKIKQGDRQAPEGFYNVTPAQMNPNSQYYLSFNLGYPNAFDRSHGRTGSHLMVHGDCSSAGCYSMTDAQMAEIFALGRESFFGGQRSFQVQAYPFRMTPTNMARHRNSPHFAFWKMLKEGNDHFEVTRAEPKVDVCGKRYVFNATASSPFQPAGPCPAMEVQEEIAQAVAAKRQRDDQRFAEALAKVTPAPVKVGNDGGMHPVFVSTVNPQIIQDDKGNVRWQVENPKGAVPRIADAPQVEPTVQLASAEPTSLPETTAASSSNRPSAAASLNSRRAEPAAYNAAPRNEPETGSKIGALFGSLFSFGSKTEEPATRTASIGSETESVPMPRPAPRAIRALAQAPASAPAQPAAAASPARADQPAMAARPNPASGASLMSGAQPVVQGGSFDSRWATFR